VTDPGAETEEEQPTTSLGSDEHAQSSGSAELTVSHAALTFSQTQAGKWSPSRAWHELQAARELRQQTEIERQAEFERQETAKSNDQRLAFQRDMFRVVQGIVVVAVTLSVLVIAFAHNTDTKEKAWSMLTLIVGGAVGGAVGYLTGRSGK